MAYIKIRDKCSLTYTFAGNLDVEDVCKITNEFPQELPGVRKLVFDCSHLEDVPVEGLRMMLEASRKVTHGNVWVRHVSVPLREILDRTGLSKIVWVE